MRILLGMALLVLCFAAQSQELSSGPAKGAKVVKTQSAEHNQQDAKEREDKATDARVSFWSSILLVLFTGAAIHLCD